MSIRALSIIGYLLMAGGCVGLFLAHSILSTSPIGMGIQLAAAGLMLWARLVFGRRSFHAAANPTEGGVVTKGPYHFIRHPIYTAVCLFFGISLLAHFSILNLAFGVLIGGGTLIRLHTEERLLVEKYPEYLDYARKTKRMIPYLF